MTLPEAAGTSLDLESYGQSVRLTDLLPAADLRPVLLGLVGEVGSVMAPAKKLHREREAYRGYQWAAEEEFGDTLWYFAALAGRLGHLLPDLIAHGASGSNETLEVSSPPDGVIDHLASTAGQQALDDALLDLGSAAAALLVLVNDQSRAAELLRAFAVSYLRALHASRLTLVRVVERNRAKTRGRFLDPDRTLLPTFDSAFDIDERLPAHFEINIKQRRSGHSCLQWNGVFIGDPLTDNILDSDGYRFHDVFHMAHAAVLHWSPTFRSLIKHKRKSDRVIDEAQDGGRAIVVEEGLTAWLFTRAKDLRFFDGQSTVSFDLLKTVGEFVEGYEVQACPLKLWEDAILQGYEVFRQVRAENGGVVIGDRDARTLRFRSLDVE